MTHEPIDTNVLPSDYADGPFRHRAERCLHIQSRADTTWRLPKVPGYHKLYHNILTDYASRTHLRYEKWHMRQIPRWSSDIFALNDVIRALEPKAHRTEELYEPSTRSMSYTEFGDPFSNITNYRVYKDLKSDAELLDHARRHLEALNRGDFSNRY